MAKNKPFKNTVRQKSVRPGGGPASQAGARQGGSRPHSGVNAKPNHVQPTHKYKKNHDTPGHGDKEQPEPKPSDNGYWLYGRHAVEATLQNPRRKILRLLATGETGMRLEETLAQRNATPPGGAPQRRLPAWESIEREALTKLLGPDAVHQGLAARVMALPETDIFDICDQARERKHASVVVLDQVTDPHNVGAILRSAAAFGALAVILTERHAAPESGALAKAASGALDIVPLVRVTNLARTLALLKDAGFWCAGLAADGETTLAKANLSGRVALLLGAEGPGLRRLTRENCDLLVRLPTQGPIGHLNVSNAAAVALYELARGSSS